MDCCVGYNRTPISIDALPFAVKSQASGVFNNISFSSSSSACSSTSSFKKISDLKISKFVPFNRRNRGRKSVIVTAASAESSHCNFSGVGTPLEPRSSAGEFLSNILQNQRHLFPFAVIEQLDLLASDRDGAVARKRHSLGSPESCLHRRIAEMKGRECQIAVEDVIYMSIVHKFSEIGVPMVPRLSYCIRNGKLETWPAKDEELKSIHSVEVQEMIREHLGTILGLRGGSIGTDKYSTTPIRRLQLGRVYAASVMYGYFLKSASLRYQFESGLCISNEHIPLLPLRYGMIHAPVARFHKHNGPDSLALVGESGDSRSTSLCQEPRRCGGQKREKLRDFVMGFDSETLQRCARIKSEEAVNVIEKHTWGLVRDDAHEDTKSEDVILLTFSSLERLVLEAVAFGSFLWDVEGYVDSVYRLKEN